MQCSLERSECQIARTLGIPDRKMGMLLKKGTPPTVAQHSLRSNGPPIERQQRGIHAPRCIPHIARCVIEMPMQHHP